MKATRLAKTTAISILQLTTILSLTAFANETPETNNPALYPPVEIGAVSQQIPPGVKLKIKFVTPLDSKLAHIGDNFVATTSEDLWAKDQLIIPKGTAVRGRVQEVQKPSFFSKGGLLRLSFDHILMPSGELKPLTLDVDASSQKMSRERNALYTDPGIGSKLNTSVDKGIDQYKYFHDKGVAAGKQMGGGMNMLLTVPTNTIAGVATGTAVTTANAAKAVFGKGESVTLNPGDELIIDLSKATTLQGQ